MQNATQEALNREVFDAAQKGQIGRIKFAIVLGGKAIIVGYDGWTPLHYVVCRGDLKAIQAILNGSPDIDAKTVAGGFTACHLAAACGRTAIIQLLCENGADIDMTTRDGRSVLNILGAVTTPRRFAELRDKYSVADRSF